MSRKRITAEPFRTRVIEPLPCLTLDERLQRIDDAGYNTFLLNSKDIYIDLLTDEGSSANFRWEWENSFSGDNSYAGSRSFDRLVNIVLDVYGLPYVIPVHLGRIAEKLLFELFLKRGQFIPTNKYFGISRYDLKISNRVLFDCINDQGLDISSELAFKGNIDIDKLNQLVNSTGQDSVAFIFICPCINMMGGQPTSMKNIKLVAEWAHERSLLTVFDISRASENAFFIQKMEDSFQQKSIREILKEMISYSDICVYSNKKDNVYPGSGGFIATKDQNLYTIIKNKLFSDEGLPSYGGLSGSSMELLAENINTGTQEKMVHSRIHQVLYLGNKLIEAEIPVVKPIGGHAVFVDARSFLPHLENDLFPAQSLAAALYIDSGIRSLERGTVSAGRNPETGANVIPQLDIVRLSVPHHVYSNLHMDVVAESCVHLYANRNNIAGLKILYESDNYRFFDSKFKPVLGSLFLDN